MKEEDRELKEKCRGQNIPPTRWDLYRARKKRERERRKQSSADENSSEMTLRRIKRIFSETDLFRGNSRSDIILQITSLLVLVVSFLNHGCLEDFQEHLEIILKKLCHVPGGSASSSTIPSYVKIEKFLHVVMQCLPILGPRFSVTPEEV